MFGPELYISMYKCCFLAYFCASQRVQRRKAELTLAQIREKLPNGWADWPQNWHTCAHSYGNGYTPNKLPLEIQGGGGGHLRGFRGSTIQKAGDAVRLAQIWHTSADPSGNGYTPNKFSLETQGGGGTLGVLVVKHSKVLGSCQTAGPIGTNFGSRLRIHLGMDTR